MFGYLNVILAAAFLWSGASDTIVLGVLTERSASAFTFSDVGVAWRELELDAHALELAREGIRGQHWILLVPGATGRREGTRVRPASMNETHRPDLRIVGRNRERRRDRLSFAEPAARRVPTPRVRESLASRNGDRGCGLRSRGGSAQRLAGGRRSPRRRTVRRRIPERRDGAGTRRMARPAVAGEPVASSGHTRGGARQAVEGRAPARARGHRARRAGGVGDYTDFYASVHHATNVGRMLRPDNPLLPNYKWMPIGYHGRASSIVVSGTPVRRPCGQVDARRRRPRLRAERVDSTTKRRWDSSSAMGTRSASRSRWSTPTSTSSASCIVNDWSARDIQAWEYQPLGPFLAKSFATTVSPWVVTTEALEPFRVPWRRAHRAIRSRWPTCVSDHATPAELSRSASRCICAPRDARAADSLRYVLSRGNLADLYWSPAQLVAHHTSNGCNLRPGDLIASGTVSGPERDSRGCLLELTWRGTEPVLLPTARRAPVSRGRRRSGHARLV